MSLFSKQVKMLEESKLSIVRYTIAIVIDISFSLIDIHRYRSINIAMHRLFDVLLHRSATFSKVRLSFTYLLISL